MAVEPLQSLGAWKETTPKMLRARTPSNTGKYRWLW
jgi:hypothetical protein